MLNPHDDGISIDSFVDWIEAEGYPVNRIDYGEWLERFPSVLRGLPEDQRQASLLPLMDAYARPATAVAGASVPARRFVEATAEAGVTADGQVPHLGQAMIARYLHDLKAIGLLR